LSSPLRLVCAAVLVWGLSGCASRVPVPALPAGPAVELASTPFFPQDDYQCGPAALATVLVADGVAVTPEQLVPQVYVPGKRGSLQAEITAAVRRQERVPTMLAPRLDAVTQSLQAGKPVLVFLNLGLDAAPVWHYAVVIGFDPAQDSLLLRSGREARQAIGRKRFDAAWERAGRWAVTVGDADTVPETASPESWIAAVAPFETRGVFAVAERGYRAGIERWPGAALPYTALGNVHAARGDWLGAVDAFSDSLARAETPIVFNNRGYALARLGCLEAARSDLRRGLALESPPEIRQLLVQTQADLGRLTAAVDCPSSALPALLAPEPVQ
jgi:hypothetical protein